MPEDRQKNRSSKSSARGHGVQELPESGEKFPVEVALLEDHATLVLDTTTGPSLHKRGYRKLVGQAPLKETFGGRTHPAELLATRSSAA